MARCDSLSADTWGRYELNSDGCVYAFGTDAEVHQTSLEQRPPAKQMLVYLARMPRDTTLTYPAWTYFAGLDADGAPEWSANWLDSVLIEGLSDPSRPEKLDYPVPHRRFTRG